MGCRLPCGSRCTNLNVDGNRSRKGDAPVIAGKSRVETPPDQCTFRIDDGAELSPCFNIQLGDADLDEFVVTDVFRRFAR